MNQDEQKKAAAQAALEYIKNESVIGVGTGTTVHCFIDLLADLKGQIEMAVSSSVDSEKRLKAIGIEVQDLNYVGKVPVYIDGADAFNSQKQLVKGGGGALTREKILAGASDKYVCIVDKSKQVDVLGKFPLAVEVIPMARGYVAREIVKLGGDPEWREGFVTDNGNIILDIHAMKIVDPIALEQQLNNIPGVVTNGLFAARGADVILMSTDSGVETIG
jgi:ribose 5-phosphate isomerase A